MLPKIASDKENGWACLAAQFSKSVGKQTSVPQMTKKTFKQYETSCQKRRCQRNWKQSNKIVAMALERQHL